MKSLKKLATIVLCVALILLAASGAKAADQKNDKPSINWNYYDHLLVAPDNVQAFLVKNDPHRFFLHSFNQQIKKLHYSIRPLNLAWGDDIAEFERHYVAVMEPPLATSLQKTDDFISDLIADPQLCNDFFEWVCQSIKYYGPATQGSDAVLYLITEHLKTYLDTDELRHDAFFYAYCKEHGIQDWFNSKGLIFEESGMLYLDGDSIINPYRPWETFVFKLIEDFKIPSNTIRQWLDVYPPTFIINENPVITQCELTPPPKLIANTYYDLEADTIWLTDIALAWISELKWLVDNHTDEWGGFVESLELENIIGNYFDYHLETDYVTRYVRAEILDHPKTFKALVNWMSPAVKALMNDMTPRAKQDFNLHIDHLLDYLHNGSYERDLEYERIIGPISPGFAIEYEPNSFIIRHGHVCYGTRNENPYRDDEIRLFVALQYNVDKGQFETLLKKIKSK